MLPRKAPDLAVPHRSAVEQELQRVLQSPLFRGGSRAEHCLRFIVERALDGQTDRLKERCIGAEVFGRDPNYDTGSDAIVRVTVNDLRKKLAQFYMNPGTPPAVRIDLPTGSYMPEFHFAEPGPEKGQPASSAARLRLLLLSGLCLLALAALTYGLVRRSRPEAALEKFWAPLLRGDRSVLVCVGNPVVYVPSTLWKERFHAAHPGLETFSPFIYPLAESALSAGDIVASNSQFVAAGDALATSRIAATLSRLSKRFEVRTGVDVTYADLRSSPSVLIGYSNLMHRELAKGLRFTVELVNETEKRVRDNATPEKSFLVTGIQPDGRSEVDYGIISRLAPADTGQPIIQVAGVTQSGTRAAGEFVCDENALKQALSLLPQNWASRNLQIVIRVRVLGQTISPPKIVAAHSW